MRYRPPSPGCLLRVDLAGMAAVYDRRAGVTHILADPAIVILEALGAFVAVSPDDRGPTDCNSTELLARLGLGEDALPLLAERLAELVPAGLVEALP